MWSGLWCGRVVVCYCTCCIQLRRLPPSLLPAHGHSWPQSAAFRAYHSDRMYRRTHKRAHSHFSVFTIREEHSSGGEDHHYTTATTTSAAVTAAASKVRRAKSTELLAADPAQLEKQIEHELERKVHEVLRRRRRYSNVTVPTAVKFSISRGSPKQQPELAFAMARPRSPKKGVSNYQDLLDRTLASIRQQLVSDRGRDASRPCACVMYLWRTVS